MIGAFIDSFLLILEESTTRFFCFAASVKATLNIDRTVSCVRNHKTLNPMIKGLDHRDRISELPDELLLEILSFLPMTDVVATMVLSKRWKFLWMFVPRLMYDRNMYQAGEEKRSSRFIHTSLMLHKAPVLEVLDINLGLNTAARDIGVCVRKAIKSRVRQLRIQIDTSSTEAMVPVVLPSSLYCTRLVALALSNLVLTNSCSSVSFPSLKSMSLIWIKYPTEHFVSKLLSSCPVLENLIVGRCLCDNAGLFKIRVATLQILGLRNFADGFLIDAPSLKFLDANIEARGFCGIEHDMPNIEAANVYVTCSYTEQILSSLNSLKQLGLCLTTSKGAYPEGILFSRLERLHLCTCQPEWLNLLLRLLKDSPKLRILRLEQCRVHGGKGIINPRPCWNEPSDVPGCLLSSLETFEWLQYEGREEEIGVARFILRNAGRLVMAAFYPKSTGSKKKLDMLMELSMSPRGSSTCQLDFGRGKLKIRDIICDRHTAD